MAEVLQDTPEFLQFIEHNCEKIQIFSTTVCEVDFQIQKFSPESERTRSNLAIVDFLINFIDEVTENRPTLAVFDSFKILESTAREEFPKNLHFMTTEFYLTKLLDDRVIPSIPTRQNDDK